ncbi:hypothetical protein BARVI_01000 [Barnesiella viscericola DSM 18177]|uniref:Uncharacterized protein n=1 Tax=Barnesiella viscericola DSM 18177 TaxID=880074 RepID=W0ERV9_9BACT|nr:hypothetical protein BARVI_01000 [Barnesiella viscericola DSM 18177]
MAIKKEEKMIFFVIFLKISNSFQNRTQSLYHQIKTMYD